MSGIKVWGPYTNMRSQLQQGPVVVERAHGVYVYDETGRKYLDAHAGLWLANIGYGREEVLAAIQAQGEKLSWFSSFGQFANRPSLDLADRLMELLQPEGMGYVFFSNDGSEAMESALKISRQYWKAKGKPTKVKLIGREHAYHGVTMGALSVAGISANRTAFEPLLGGVRHVPAPHCVHCSFHPESTTCTMQCAHELERVIRFEGPDTVAAFVAEPVQAAGGVLFPPADYLREVREICRKYDVLFIADEVVTGFGRLGSWFGCRHYGIQPDIMTFAKGITSGYIPLGATAVRPEIVEAFVNRQVNEPEFRHGNTYSGHPLACAAALANLRIVEEEDLLGNAHQQGERLRSGLRRIQDKFPQHVYDTQAEGLLGRLELCDPTGQAVAGSLGAQAAASMMDQDVIVRTVGDVITFSPPLIITAEQIDTILSAVEQTVATIAR